MCLADLLSLTDDQKSKVHALSKQLAIAEIPYLYGSKPDYSFSVEEIVQKKLSVDCSWLTKYIFDKLGIIIQEGSSNQYGLSAIIQFGQEQIGDLVFKTEQGIIHHVGLIMGVNPSMTVEASGTFKKVVIRTLDQFKVFPPYAQFAGIRRLDKSKIKIIEG